MSCGGSIKFIKDSLDEQHFNLKFFFSPGQGDVFMWGYGKGCGNKNKDILSPEKVPLKRKVVEVSGGATHSLALSGKRFRMLLL